MDLFDAMSTCRAMRYLKSDPVEPDLIEKVITAATWAPSPGNSQGRDFSWCRMKIRRLKLAMQLKQPWPVESRQWNDPIKLTGLCLMARSISLQL